MVSSVLKILGGIADNFKEMKSAWKEHRKRSYEKKIDKYVDRIDTDAIDRVLQDIAKKRNKRRDGS